MILLQYFIDEFLICYVVKIAYQSQSRGGDQFSNAKTMQHLTSHLYHWLPSRMLHHLVAALFNSYSAPHAIFF